MFEFLEWLGRPEGAFLRNALLAGLVGSVPLGIAGSYIVVRRVSYVAAAVAHSALGGIGAALYLREARGWAWVDPMMGAVAAALLAALTIAAISGRSGQREDSVIGAIWVTGMAAGLLCLSATPGYFDSSAYLFGDILLVGPGDLAYAGALAALVPAAVWLGQRHLTAICFDPEFAALRGVPPRLVHGAMLALVALTVVLFVSIVGVVLVVALVTLPPAVAAFGARRLGRLVAGAIVLNALFVAGGIGLGYAADAPAGPVIILLAAALYLLVWGFRETAPRLAGRTRKSGGKFSK